MNDGLIKLSIVDPSVGSHTMVRFSSPLGDFMWDVSEYDRALKSGPDTTDIFQDINVFWATLPDAKQLMIATVFRTIHEIFEIEPDVGAVRSQIQLLLKELYDIMPYNDVLEWVRYHGNVRMPVTMRDDYGPNDPPDRRRTYIRRDYIELVAFAVSLRPMIPIWGEFILRSRKIAGTEYKEIQALRLLYKTSIIVSAPRYRLEDYIEGTTGYELPTFSAVVMGLGTDERSEWLLALNIIRRVATGEISSTNEQSTIVSNVFNYTKSKLEQINKTFKCNIVDKSKPSRGTEDDNVSFMEMYKVKQAVAAGDLKPAEVYTEHPEVMAQKIDPTVDTALIDVCMEAVSGLERHHTYDHQVVLAQWVCATAIPAKGMHSLTKRAVLRTLALTQAILWHWGFFDLAALVTATPYPLEENQILSNLEGRNRIPKPLVDELMTSFKYYVAVKPKANAPEGTVQRSQNAAILTIEAYFDMVRPHDWELHAPEALQALTSRIPYTKKLVVPADIRAQIAKLIIKIAR